MLSVVLAAPHPHPQVRSMVHAKAATGQQQTGDRLDSGARLCTSPHHLLILDHATTAAPRRATPCRPRLGVHLVLQARRPGDEDRTLGRPWRGVAWRGVAWRGVADMMPFSSATRTYRLQKHLGPRQLEPPLLASGCCLLA